MMDWERWLNPRVGEPESIPFMVVWGLLIFVAYKLTGMGDSDTV
jgi:hypothetical protein